MEIYFFFKKNDTDIFSLNETWLASNFKPYIPNYINMRNDRPRTQGGGVAILVYPCVY